MTAKEAIAILAAVAAVVALADICRSGAPRGLRYPDMKIRICQNDRHGFEITEDAALFRAKFATMDYPEYYLNWAEYKQLAIVVAQTIAAELGCTNNIRIVHWEQPPVANTNDIGEAVAAMLKGKFVTDEIVTNKFTKAGK